MFEYRVTKYNPVFRDSNGAYTRDEWISFDDIGSSFGGVVLTREEFDRIEAAYVAVALAFLREAGISSLVVEGLENSAGHPLGFGEDSVLPLQQDGTYDQFWKARDLCPHLRTIKPAVLTAGSSGPTLERLWQGRLGSPIFSRGAEFLHRFRSRKGRPFRSGQTVDTQGLADVLGVDKTKVGTGDVLGLSAMIARVIDAWR